MSNKGLPALLENVAGIDIGTEHFHLSVDGETVVEYNTFTPSMIEMARFINQSKVTDVAIEATGVLWMPLFDMLEKHGIKVHLFNPVHAKNIPAQKSDPIDCRWLRKVLMYGLVRDSFIPNIQIRQLRIYVRQREDLIETQSQSIQHMQRAFELMNIKLHNVISDTVGVTGKLIIETILKGERDAGRLTKIAAAHIRAEKLVKIEAALTGNYQEEYVFLLEQAYEKYNFIQKLIRKCDKKIEKFLKRLTKDKPEPPTSTKKNARHNNPEIKDLHTLLLKATGGKNAAELPFIADKTYLKLIAETGTDLTIWPTHKHFTSYIGLSPRKKQSGKMNLNMKVKVKSKIGQIFRECAMSVAASKYPALKGFYNRIKSRAGHKIALKATARKLAVLFYLFMTRGIEYVEIGLKKYEQQYKEKMLQNLERKARAFGFSLTPYTA